LDEVPEERRRRNEFQVTATLAEDIQKATSQLDLALFLNAMLDMKPDRTPRPDRSPRR
jgi:predicted component of type VI protein secretion system